MLDFSWNRKVLVTYLGSDKFQEYEKNMGTVWYEPMSRIGVTRIIKLSYSYLKLLH